MFPTKITNPMKKLAASIVALAATAGLATTASADAENYQRTLNCTTWVIASDAENNTSSGTGVLVGDGAEDVEQRVAQEVHRTEREQRDRQDDEHHLRHPAEYELHSSGPPGPRLS